MKSRLIAVFLAATLVGALVACGSTTSNGSPTPAPTSTPTDIANSPTDVAVQAYLALMDELATELTRFGDPDGPGGSTEEVIDLVNRLEAYAPFFSSLDQDSLEQVLTTYGQQIEETATRVAKLVLAADEIAGNETIVSALQRTPAFAIADSSDGKPPLPTVEKVVKAGEPSTAEESFRTLLTEEDVRAVLTSAVALTTRFFDYRALAEGVDPAQVEKMDSWYGLSFDAADGTKGVTFSAIDFASTLSAQDHFEKMKSETPGMQEMDPTIGDASIEVEVNTQGIGSMLVFIYGDRVVSLHTTQPDDQEPLVSLAGLEELAELVASRP